jgi:hypothetical protein
MQRSPADPLDALALSATVRIDVSSNRRRADKTDRFDGGIVQNRVDRLSVAINDVEHAGRKPGLDKQFGQTHRYRRIAFGRLEDKSVAAGQRRADLPERDHRREVERCDARDNTERLPHGIHIDVRARAVAEFPFHQVRRAGAKFDDIQAALDVAPGVGGCLAMFHREQPGQIVELDPNEVGKLR